MPPKKQSSKKTTSTKTKKPALSKHYFGVLLENINSKVQQLTESFSTVATKEDVEKIDFRLEKVETKVNLIEKVVSDHSSQLNQLTKRVGHISGKLDQTNEKIDHISHKVDDIFNSMATKDDIRNHEHRLVSLEQK